MEGVGPVTTVALLGATGNLGRAVSKRVVDHGWTLVEISRGEAVTLSAPAHLDVVVNCAGAGMDSMRPSTSRDLLHANVVAAISAARLALDSGARLVHLGSAAELASGATQESPYVRSKRMASDALALLAGTDGLRGFELLPHLVYGDPSPVAGGVIAAMVRSMSSGEAFGLRTPHLRRDFVHRDDVARAVLAAIEARTSSWETLEIGSGRGHELSEVAEIIGRLLGVDQPWRHEPIHGRTWNEDQVADPGPADERLSFRTEIELMAGLQLLVRQTVEGAFV
jgi:nucleoside-diphosphate-sugar epimerase